MAIIDVTISQLSESVAEATLLNWKKSPGDAVAVDEILFEIETDKVVFDVPSPSAGILFEILVGDGGTVVPNQVLARIDSEGKTAATTSVASVPDQQKVETAQQTAVPKSDGGVAMPAAAKLMAETGLKHSQVEGTGRHGRVTKADVLQAIAAGAEPASPPPPPAPKLKPVEANLEAPLMLSLIHI